MAYFLVFFSWAAIPCQFHEQPRFFFLNMKFVNIQLKTGAFPVPNLFKPLILHLDFIKQFSTWEKKN